PVGSWYNVTILVKMDFKELQQVDPSLLNHMRLLHSLVGETDRGCLHAPCGSCSGRPRSPAPCNQWPAPSTTCTQPLGTPPPQCHGCYWACCGHCLWPTSPPCWATLRSVSTK
ncbi:UMODL1 isoform 5, partial [Pongo abelii]